MRGGEGEQYAGMFYKRTHPREYLVRLMAERR